MGVDALMQDAFMEDAFMEDAATVNVQVHSTPRVQECIEIETQHVTPPISKWFKYF